MRDADGPDANWDEDIQGAPPVVPRAELQQRRQTETVTVNRYLYQQVQQLEHMLLTAVDLQALLEILLVSLPRHFSFQASELWLYDAEGALEPLIVNRDRYGRNLQLMRDVFGLQDLYDAEPDITLIDATDSRMFEVLKSDHGISYALLMPLLDSGRLIGSLHWGFVDDSLSSSDSDKDLVAHLGSIISICFQNAVSRQRLSQLSLLDPQTEIGNRRGFEVEFAREIARARRDKSAVTLLMLELDEFEDLSKYHGKSSSEYVVRKVAERIAHDLRSTDRIARLSDAGLAVLLPSTGEVVGQEVADRMRRDLEEFPVDDGRGAVMHTTLSIGLATWEPLSYPAVDMRQLARQLESAAGKGLSRALSRNGNQVIISRLSALLI